MKLSQEPNPYAVERCFMDPHSFIEIEFYDDHGQHRVWPYTGESFPYFEGKEHFPVNAAFESQASARAAALAIGRIHQWVTEENGRFILQNSADLSDPLLESPRVGDLFVVDGEDVIRQVTELVYTHEWKGAGRHGMLACVKAKQDHALAAPSQ